MTRYNKKELVYYKKDGKPIVAAIVDAGAKNMCLHVIQQDGTTDLLWLISMPDTDNMASVKMKRPDPVKKITDKIYNKLTPELQDVVDNFNFEQAVRNFRDRAFNRNL